MKQKEGQKHRLNGLKDFTEEKSVPSEQSKKIRNADKMKQGWEIKKLGQVAEIEYGYTDKASSIGDYRYIRITDIDNEGLLSDIEKVYVKSNAEAKSFLLDNGDLLMARTGATFAKVLFYEDFEPSIFASYLIRIKFKNPIENKFYWYFSKSRDYWEQANTLSSGAAQPQFNGNALKQVLFPFPKSLPEQQRIVSILDECFAAIDKAKANAEQNLKNAKELFESYLQGVFEKKGDGWEVKAIGDIGSPKMCRRIFKEQTTAFGDIPFYKIGTFGKEPDAYISRAIYDEFRTKYSFPKKGDVLISASGTIGKRVRYDGEPAYFQDSNIVWIENDEKQVSNDFLYEFYGACNWGSTKGATISRLYNDNLKNIKISFPKSLKEQQTIVRQLDALRAETQKLEAVYQKKIDDLEELKKSILQKAFAGELRDGKRTERKNKKAVVV